VLEILSRIRGEKLPGLKENEREQSTASTLSKKWTEQRSALRKRCLNISALRYMLVSATLTKGVRGLAWPILGRGCAVIDGDAGERVQIERESDLSDFNVDKPKCTVSFIDESKCFSSYLSDLANQCALAQMR
jgi:hypothetical protein